MAEPDLGFMGALNTFLPYVVAIVVGLVAMVLFVWYTKKYTPEIARIFIKGYHSRGLPVFIQDEMGNVELQICDKKFPEGVIHTKRSGWYLLPSPPNPEDKDGEGEAEEKRGPERPSKASLKQVQEMSQDEKEAYAKAYGMLVQTPILRGFGKQVFFGSSVSSAVSNLTAIAHADLPSVRKLSPLMYQKTQLDALATGSRIEGQKMAGKDMTKWIFAAIAAAIVLGSLGLVVYLLTNHGSAAALSLLAGVF